MVPAGGVKVVEGDGEVVVDVVGHVGHEGLDVAGLKVAEVFLLELPLAGQIQGLAVHFALEESGQGRRRRRTPRQPGLLSVASSAPEKKEARKFQVRHGND